MREHPISVFCGFDFARGCLALYNGNWVRTVHHHENLGMGRVTNRKCTCAKFDADVANLSDMYNIFHTRFSTPDSP